MPLLEHLEELRQRLLRVLIALAIGVILASLITRPIIQSLVAPIADQVQATRLTENFSVFFKVASVIGIVIAMPVIVYQLFRFASPGLKRTERRYVIVGVPLATLSFGSGVVFAARVILPSAIPFLNTFLADMIPQRPTIDPYITLVTNVMLWTGLVFETPLVMFFLAKLGVVTPQGFAKARRVVIIGAAIASAIITPTTDVVNMLLIMVPFIVLYEMGILLARFA
jgi:sec-independent protein translocase protein TatC